MTQQQPRVSPIHGPEQYVLPGRPEGAECQAARALYALLVSRYG